MASAQLVDQFGFQLVRRDGEWDKENPSARPQNGQRLAGYVGNYRTFETDSLPLPVTVRFRGIPYK